MDRIAIGQNYGIMSTKIKCKFITLPDMIFLSQFSILIGKQIGIKGKHFNIEFSTQSSAESQYFDIKPDIQIAIENQQSHYRIQHINNSEVRRKAWYLDYIYIIIRSYSGNKNILA